MIDAALRLARAGFTLDVALRLPSRGVSALFGPSGCGKTTVLRALAGLERAAGRVLLDGEPWQDDAAGTFVPTHRRAIGYVIQEAALFPHLDVRGNLDYGRRRAGGGAGRIALDQAVELLGIGALMARRPDTLSGGERQRVAIARALAANPRLLLMDEPLAALDAARKAEVLPYLQRLHDELALPIVYVSHAIEEVTRLARQVVLLEQGRVIAAGAPAELTARLDLPTARADDAGVVLDGIVAERDAHWQLARLAVGGDDFRVWVDRRRRAPGPGVGARARRREPAGGAADAAFGACAAARAGAAGVGAGQDRGAGRVKAAPAARARGCCWNRPATWPTSRCSRRPPAARAAAAHGSPRRRWSCCRPGRRCRPNTANSSAARRRAWPRCRRCRAC